MDVLIIVSNPEALALAKGLGAAAQRRGVDWSVFFTNDGVRSLADTDFAQTVKSAAQAVACQESWQAHMGAIDCPIELGSQTDNSAMVAAADKVISF